MNNPLTSHQLAKILLSLPDKKVSIDETGEYVVAAELRACATHEGYENVVVLDFE